MTREIVEKLYQELISSFSGEPLTEQKESSIKIPIPEFQFNDVFQSPGVTVDNEQQKNFFKAVRNAGLSGKIQNLNSDIQVLNNFMSEFSPKSEESHTSVIGKLVILQTLHNLLNHDSGSSAGFSFEKFIAILYNGRVVAGNADIIDITFSDQQSPVSLKFIRGTRVTGSNDLLKKAGPVTYFVGRKFPDRGAIVFYSKVLDPAQHDLERGVSLREFEEVGTLQLSTEKFMDTATMGLKMLDNIFGSLRRDMEDLVAAYQNAILNKREKSATTQVASDADTVSKTATDLSK
tara:strand:+ start:3213 stop:4085 length:873 start_codon:yes stop_codon:yes gene_type:complete